MSTKAFVFILCLIFISNVCWCNAICEHKNIKNADFMCLVLHMRNGIPQPQCLRCTDCYKWISYDVYKHILNNNELDELQKNRKIFGHMNDAQR